MNPLDVALWALAAIAIAVAAGMVVAVVAVVGRFLGEQAAALTGYRARAEQEAAEARAGAQRAELEAADILEKRLALPFGGTTSLGEQLTERLDKSAQVIRVMQDTNDALVRQLGTMSNRVDRLEEQRRAEQRRVALPRVQHADRPLRPGER